MNSSPSALFVGISTLDIEYLVDQYPTEDSKNQAADQFLGAGGPASNAAIAFAFLSGCSPTLLTALGRHYLAEVIRADLHKYDVQTIDATPESDEQPPISSITVARQNGSRTIVSLDASRITASFDDSFISVVEDADIVLVDCHYKDLAIRAAQYAMCTKIPVVLDAGRWKDSYAEILGFVDVAICSSTFSPPSIDGTNVEGVFRYIHGLGVPFAAITNGSKSIEYSVHGKRGTIPVPVLSAVDTSGAGDILHGSFCHYFIQSGGEFVDALRRAATIASTSCKYFGTRQWMDQSIHPQSE